MRLLWTAVDISDSSVAELEVVIEFDDDAGLDIDLFADALVSEITDDDDEITQYDLDCLQSCSHFLESEMLPL